METQSVMETQQSVAEELPALYRAILDGVAQLEMRGQRREALLVRAEATRVYSSAWDELARRRLASLCRRIQRVVAGKERPRSEANTSWTRSVGSLSVR